MNQGMTSRCAQCGAFSPNAQAVQCMQCGGPVLPVVSPPQQVYGYGAPGPQPYPMQAQQPQGPAFAPQAPAYGAPLPPHPLGYGPPPTTQGYAPPPAFGQMQPYQNVPMQPFGVANQPVYYPRGIGAWSFLDWVRVVVIGIVIVLAILGAIFGQ